MEALVLLLLLVAAGLFVAGFFMPSHRYGLMSGGLFFWVLTEIITRL